MDVRNAVLSNYAASLSVARKRQDVALVESSWERKGFVLVRTELTPRNVLADAFFVVRGRSSAYWQGTCCECRGRRIGRRPSPRQTFLVVAIVRSVVMVIVVIVIVVVVVAVPLSAVAACARGNDALSSPAPVTALRGRFSAVDASLKACTDP